MVFCEAVIRVQEQHQQKVVTVIKCLESFALFLVEAKRDIPEGLNLDVDDVFFAETKSLFHWDCRLSVDAFVLELGRGQFRLKDLLDFLVVG